MPPSLFARFRFSMSTFSLFAASVCAVGTMVGVGAMPLGAQQKPQASPGTPATAIAAAADSIAAAGDTAKAVAMLEAALKADKKNGPAWHRLGVLLWNQTKSKRTDAFISDPKIVRMVTAADSSLRIATQLSPDSATYWLDLMQFNATSGVSTAMFAAGGNARKALDAAKAAGNAQQIALAATGAGNAAWRRYEGVANRAIAADQRQINVTNLTNGGERMHAADYINNIWKRVEPPTGSADYEEALGYYTIALEADPTNTRIARCLYMVLGERDRWEDLRQIATRRASQYPFDFQSQLALGLAAQRLGQAKVAQVAFDSALVLMDESTRDRMMSLSRILRPKLLTNDPRKRPDGISDSIAFAALNEEQRRAVASLYWYMADPISMTRENEYRNEFLSRVAWADFRWSSEDQNLLGADTDRGDIYIRYGPPQTQMLVRGKSDGSEGAGNTLTWMYASGLVFFFDEMPGYLSARTAFDDKNFVAALRNESPVSFANVPAAKLMDTIPVAMTRFRARGDSSDVVIAASIPTSSLVKGTEVDRAPVEIGLRIIDQHVKELGIDSSHVDLPITTSTPLARSWVRRVGPGLNVVRVEALQPDTRRAARAMSQVPAVGGSGFGMSDVLLGTSPTVKQGVNPNSWRDIQTTPMAGVFADPKIGLTWETYDLQASDGQNKYHVDVAIERVSKGLKGFSARLVDNLGRTLGREQRGTNTISMSFPRAVAAAPTHVDFFTINLGEATTGEYRLQVTITDDVSGKKTSRGTTFWMK